MNYRNRAQTPIIVIAVVVLVAVAAVAVYFLTKGPSEKQEIVFYTPSWGVDIAEELITLYEEENPDVEVTLIRGPSEWADHVSKTTIWMKEKYDGVDILYHDDVFTLDGAYLGNWVKLDDYLTSEEKALFTDFQKTYHTLHGGIYRIPWFDGGSFLYYRKDFFEAEGVSVPTTWDEMVEVGKKLTKDLDGDGTIDQWGFVTTGVPGDLYNIYTEYLLQAGGEEWKIAPDGVPDPAAEKALKFLYDLIHTHKIMPVDMTTWAYTEIQAVFREGKAAMMRGWAILGESIMDWGMGDVVGIADYPAGPGGSWGFGDCWGLVVNAYGKNKDLAIDFAKFCLRPEEQKITARVGVPSIKPLYDDAAYMAELATKNVTVPYAKEILKHRVARGFPPGNATAYHEAIGREISSALVGDVTIEEALINIQEAIDPLLP